MNDFLGDGALLADIYDCNITFCVYQQKANQFFLVCSWEWPLGNLFGNNVSLVGTRGPGGILFCFACFHFQNFVYFFCHVLNQYQQFSGLRAICWVITFHWSRDSRTWWDLVLFRVFLIFKSLFLPCILSTSTLWWPPGNLFGNNV